MQVSVHQGRSAFRAPWEVNIIFSLSCILNGFRKQQGAITEDASASITVAAAVNLNALFSALVAEYILPVESFGYFCSDQLFSFVFVFVFERAFVFVFVIVSLYKCWTGGNGNGRAGRHFYPSRFCISTPLLGAQWPYR